MLLHCKVGTSAFLVAVLALLVFKDTWHLVLKITRGSYHGYTHVACMPTYNLCMSIVVLDRIHSTFTVFVYANHQKLERSKNTIRVTFNQGKNNYSVRKT